VFDAVGLIYFPNLKTHGFTRLAGAVKNFFLCLPMFVKAEGYVRFPDTNDFLRLPTDIATLVKPIITYWHMGLQSPPLLVAPTHFSGLHKETTGSASGVRRQIRAILLDLFLRALPAIKTSYRLWR
jgi:hypothetical protein